MKKVLGSILKIIIPLGLGVFLIWLAYDKLTEKDIEDIKRAFKEINYFYLFLSVFFGVLSHLSRAWRWKYPLEPLGYQPKFLNSFYAVMIGYFANLGIPRSGEVMRCGVMAKYENMSFNKLVGTVIAERVADFLILIAFIIITIFIQMDLILGQLSKAQDKFSMTLVYGLIGMMVLGVVGFIILKKSNSKFYLKLRDFIAGILEGVKTILTMEKKWLFIGHTIFIWFMYFMMFYITFFSLEDIQEVPLSGILTAFVMGGLSIALTNGGIGAYPYGVAETLLLYGVAFNVGYAFGWAVWVAQTIMIVSLGLASMILMPRYNRSTQS